MPRDRRDFRRKGVAPCLRHLRSSMLAAAPLSSSAASVVSCRHCGDRCESDAITTPWRLLLRRMRNGIHDSRPERSPRLLRLRDPSGRITEDRPAARSTAIRRARRSVGGGRGSSPSTTAHPRGRRSRSRRFTAPRASGCSSSSGVSIEGVERSEVDLLRRYGAGRLPAGTRRRCGASRSSSRRSATSRSLCRGRARASGAHAAGCTCRSASPALRSATSCCSASRAT